jgi:hypothetical protein
MFLQKQKIKRQVMNPDTLFIFPHVTASEGTGRAGEAELEFGHVKGWKIQQTVFVGGTCGSIHVESFNRNMKALGVLESKWDPIRKKLVRRLLEEQDKVLRSYFAQKGGTRSKGEDRINCKGREHIHWDIYA